ncbi:MAG TPA: outer membrane beta-barrel protein [Roseiarcus sp.]
MTRSHLHPFANVGALGAVLALTVAAHAADLGEKPLPPSPPPALPSLSHWAGFYAGATYGAGYSSVKSSQVRSSTASAWGQSAGALLGYNFQYGPLVFGPEGDFDWHILRPINNGGPGLGASVNDTLETFRLRARVGYDMGQFLPFVAAGVASAKVYEYGYPWPNLDQGQSREETGLTLGAGLEYRFAAPFIGPVTLRGEYIYDTYPSQTFTIGSGPIRAQTSEQFFRVGIITYPDANWRPQASPDFKPDWSGPYGGLLVGDLWSQQHTSLNGVSTNFDANGGEVGIFTGRNFMFGPWMLGYEGAALASNTSGNGPQPGIAQTSFRNYFEADLRARAGYAFGRFLPYVTVGGDWGRSEQSDLATGSFRGRVYTDSITAGGGVEYALSERWAARVEYLIDSQIGTTNTQLDDLNLRQSRFAQTARLGLAYYFH